jgi:hypothetical protein
VSVDLFQLLEVLNLGLQLLDLRGLARSARVRRRWRGRAGAAHVGVAEDGRGDRATHLL